MNWFINDDFDRLDAALTLLLGLIAMVAVILGAPLWTFAPAGLIAGTIAMYRHFPLPPRRSPRRR